MLDMRRIPRPAIPLIGSALALAVLAPAPAHAQLAVDEIAIVAGSATEISGPAWFFVIEVIGQDLTGGSVTPPGGGSLPLVDASGQGLEIEYEDGPFASFSALQAAHPAGTYTVILSEGDSVALAWSPTEPLGADQPFLAIVQPADGAVGVSSMPSVDFDFDCTNCKDLNLEITDVATGGMTGSLQFGELDVAGGAFTDPIPFGSMRSGQGPPAPLPDGDYDADLLIALVDFTDQGFDPPSSLPSFEYIEASALLAQSTFTVPEPTRDVATLAALGMLVLLRARAPRSGSPSCGQALIRRTRGLARMPRRCLRRLGGGCRPPVA